MTDILDIRDRSKDKNNLCDNTAQSAINCISYFILFILFFQYSNSYFCCLNSI